MTPALPWYVGNQVELNPVIESREVATATVEDAIREALDSRWPAVT
jgi:hypothetical protein